MSTQPGYPSVGALRSRTRRKSGSKQADYTTVHKNINATETAQITIADLSWVE